MTKAGQGEIDIVPVMGGFRSTVDSEVGTAGKSSSNRFASAFGNGIKGLGAFVGKSLAVAGGLAAGIAAIAVKGGITKALQIENATAKMTGLGNSTETVATVMDNALAAVKGTAFGLGDAANVASTALASGIKPGKEMATYLTLVSDAAAQAQIPLGEMGQIMGKVTNSGKVSNEVLEQFGARGVGALQMLANHYGVTAAEMTSMVSKGKVDAATFNEVLTKNIGGAAKKSGDTTTGAFANMKSALSNLGMVLSAGFFPLFKKIFNQIQFTIDGIQKRIKPAAEAFGKWFQGKAGPAIANFSTVALAAFDAVFVRVVAFGTGFALAMSGVDTTGASGKVQRFGIIVGNVFKEMRGGVIAFGAAWRANDGDITSSGFPGFMERLANATRPVADALKSLDFSSFSAFTGSLGSAGGSAGKSLGSIGDSIKTLMPAFKEFGTQLPNIGGALVKLGGVSLNILTTSLAFLAQHVDTIITWMPAIVAGFVAWKIASGALAGSQQALQAAQVAMIPVTTINTLLRIAAVNVEHQHSVAIGQTTIALNMNLLAMARQKVAQIGSNIATAAGAVAHRAQAIAVGLTSASTIRATAATVAKNVVTVAGSVATGVATAAQWAFNVAMSANPIGLIIIAIVALIAIIVLLVMNWSTVVGFLQGVWQAFVTWFQTIMAGFLAWWGLVWAGFLGFVTPVWNTIVAVVQLAWQIIVLAVTTYINMVLLIIQTVWAVIQVVFSTAWNIIQTIVATALAILIAIFTGNFGAIAGLIASAWDRIKGYFIGALAAIMGIVSGAWANLIGIFSGAMGAIGALLAGGWNAIQATAMAVWNALVAWIAGIPGRILAGISAIANLAANMAGWIGGVKDAAVAKFGELISWVGGVPGQIQGALGGLSGLLTGAGQQIIQGFLSGLQAGFESVKSFVGGIGSWIAAHKGPKAYDLALLVPAGGWIMGGLNTSLKAGIPTIGKTLGDVSATIRAGVETPNLDSMTTTAKATALAAASGAQGEAGERPIERIILETGGEQVFARIVRKGERALVRA